jgi:hypothetical protein
VVCAIALKTEIIDAKSWLSAISEREILEKETWKRQKMNKTFLLFFMRKF